MLDREVWISIPGHPKTKGSMKCVGRNGSHQLVESHKSAGPWLKLLTHWLGKRLSGRPAAAGQALGVEATFTLERPAYHYGTGRNAGELKTRYADAEPVGHSTGDVDKLVRVVLDALQAGDVIPNDSAVVELTARKAYVDHQARPGSDVKSIPGVVIRLYPADLDR